MSNSADPDQLASSKANWSGSTQFAKAGHIRVIRTRVKMHTYLVKWVTFLTPYLRVSNHCTNIGVTSMLQPPLFCAPKTAQGIRAYFASIRSRPPNTVTTDWKVCKLAGGRKCSAKILNAAQVSEQIRSDFRKAEINKDTKIMKDYANEIISKFSFSRAKWKCPFVTYACSEDPDQHMHPYNLIRYYRLYWARLFKASLA